VKKRARTDVLKNERLDDHRRVIGEEGEGEKTVGIHVFMSDGG